MVRERKSKRIMFAAAIASAIAAVALFAQACASQSTSGTAELYLTDSPIDAGNVAHVYITIQSIEYHMTTDWVSFDGFSGPKTFDLLALSDGERSLLGQLAIPAGIVDQIRFFVDAPVDGNATASPGCYVEFADGSTAALYVPSADTSGYKATGEFEVPVNGTVTITTDFDLRKSITEAAGRYILRPTLRLVVENEAGSIAGAVTNAAAVSSYIAYAYAHGTYTGNEALPDANGLLFANAITSGKVGDTDQFRLAFLAAGAYDVVLAQYDATGALTAVAGEVDGITVESGKTATTSFVL